MTKKIFNYIFIITLVLSIQAKAQTDESSNYNWKKVVVGGGGYVTGIVFSEAEAEVIYSRTDVGGAYRWDSLTRSWIQLFDFVSRDSAGNRCIESIAADPTDKNRVYFATGGWTGDNTGGIYWSTDQGRTLTYANTPFKMAGNNAGRGIGERLQVDPNSPNILFFGSRVHGLFKSTDYAKTWKKVSSFPITNTVDGVGLCFVVFDKMSSTPGNPTKTIYVGVSKKGNNLVKSTDGGETWLVVPGTPDAMQPHGAVIDTSGTIYLSYADGPGPGVNGTGAVMKYNSKSSVWTNITPPGSWGGFGGISLDSKKTGTIMVATAVSWGGGAVIYRSVDGGIKWKTVSGNNWIQQPIDAPYMGTGTGNWIESLKIDPFNSDRVMYVTGAGIWACNDVTSIDSNNKTHWQTAVKGIEEAGAYHITSLPAGEAILFTQFGDINGFRHTNIEVTPPEGMLTPGWGYGHCVDFAQNNVNLLVRAYASSPYGYYSTNNGKSWKPFKKTIPNAGTNLEKIHISANGSSIVWAPEKKQPYYSKDMGNSWTACSGLPKNYDYSMTSDRVNDNIFYYYDKISGYIYTSVDGGAHYKKAGLAAKWGQRIWANSKAQGDIWVPVFGQGSNSGLFHSTDKGKTFTKIPTVNEATTVSLGREAPGKTYPSIYIYGKMNNRWGVYSSIDSAQSWSLINDYDNQYGWIDYVVADARTFGRVFLSPNCMGVPYSELKFDCNGDSAGTAYYDWCGECVGGNTGKVSQCIDCNGDVNGIAFKDSCGNCVGGNTGLYPCQPTDCSGKLYGTAYFDNCGECVGGETGKTPCTTSAFALKSNSITISPNPFYDELSIESEEIIEYQVFDLFGKIVDSGICMGNCSIGFQLKTGIYILETNNGKGIISQKIIKE